MIFKKTKKALSSILIAAYFFVSAAPMGLCLATAPYRGTVEKKPELRNAAKPSSLKLEGEVLISKKNPKVSLSLRDSDVKQVLRMFADKAGMNIIFHSSVDVNDTGNAENRPGATPVAPVITPETSQNSPGGAALSPIGDTSSAARKITMDLVNVPLNDAFSMVMQVTGLTYYLDKNTIVVASAKAAQNLNLSKQELLVIPIKYVDATAMAEFLNRNIFSINKPGLSNAQIAVTNPSSNEVLIFGTHNDYLMAKKVTAQFDVKPLEESFAVNHTTPREMAELVCNVLLRTTGSDTGEITLEYEDEGDSKTGSTSEIEENDKNQNSSNNSSSTASTSTPLTLGGGVIACQYKNRLETKTLGSLRNNNLTVSYFSQRGVVSVVGGSAQQIELIKDFIAKNDKKQPQAYLEVSIIELNENGSKVFNNTWRMQSRVFSGSFDGTLSTNSYSPTFLRGDSYTTVPGTTTSYLNTVTGAMETFTTPATVLSKYIDTGTLTYSINYLIKNGKGRILANPRIMITNGENSKIDLSSDYVKSVKTEYIQNGGLTPQVQKTYEIGKDEGIIVNLVPFISPDGYVTLNITPEYSTIKEKVPDSQTGEVAVTLLQRRNLALKNIRIKDGETLVIGGMIREEEQKTVSKLPVLGDLPGIGMFFRNTSNTKDKQELVIMLTPKIIKDSEDIINKSDTTL